VLVPEAFLGFAVVDVHAPQLVATTTKEMSVIPHPLQFITAPDMASQAQLAYPTRTPTTT
jgi:hypothetical protein